MSTNGDDRAQLVHEARKTIKRMRAMARLLRCEVGEHEFKRVNKSLGEAGRSLAGRRDADVRIATLNDLRERHPDELAIAPVDALRARLEKSRPQAAGAGSESAVLAEIAEMREDLLSWNLLEHGLDSLTDGLRLIYREGRQRYRRVKRSHARDPTKVHDWRKRVKSLYYALDMLGAGDLPATAKLTKRADRLGDVLGEEHDLWMLASYVDGDEQLTDEHARQALLELIGRRRARLQHRALKIGASLYARKPKRFVERAREKL